MAPCFFHRIKAHALRKTLASKRNRRAARDSVSREQEFAVPVHFLPPNQDHELLDFSLFLDPLPFFLEDLDGDLLSIS